MKKLLIGTGVVTVVCLGFWQYQASQFKKHAQSFLTQLSNRGLSYEEANINHYCFKVSLKKPVIKDGEKLQIHLGDFFNFKYSFFTKAIHWNALGEVYVISDNPNKKDFSIISKSDKNEYSIKFKRIPICFEGTLENNLLEFLESIKSIKFNLHDTDFVIDDKSLISFKKLEFKDEYNWNETKERLSLHRKGELTNEITSSSSQDDEDFNFGKFISKIFGSNNKMSGNSEFSLGSREEWLTFIKNFKMNVENLNITALSKIFIKGETITDSEIFIGKEKSKTNINIDATNKQYQLKIEKEINANEKLRNILIEISKKNKEKNSVDTKEFENLINSLILPLLNKVNSIIEIKAVSGDKQTTFMGDFIIKNNDFGIILELKTDLNNQFLTQGMQPNKLNERIIDGNFIIENKEKLIEQISKIIKEGMKVFHVNEGAQMIDFGIGMINTVIKQFARNDGNKQIIAWSYNIDSGSFLINGKNASELFNLFGGSSSNASTPSDSQHLPQDTKNLETMPNSPVGFGENLNNANNTTSVID